MSISTKHYLDNLTKEDKKFLLDFSFNHAVDLLQLEPVKKSLVSKIIKLENHEVVNIFKLNKEVIQIQDNLQLWQFRFARLIEIVDKLKGIKKYKTESLPTIQSRKMDPKIKLFLEGLTLDLVRGIAKYLDNRHTRELSRFESIKRYPSIHNFLYLISTEINILKTNLNRIKEMSNEFSIELELIRKYVRTIDEFRTGFMDLKKEFDWLKNNSEYNIYEAIINLPGILIKFNPQLEFFIGKVSNANPDKKDIQELFLHLEILLILIKRFKLL